MKKRVFLYMTTILSLVSCGSADPNAEVKNSVAGFETGIPSVELTTVYGGNESAELWNSISSSLDKVTSASISKYSYQLSSDMVNESSAAESTSISFFGTDKQFAVKETKREVTSVTGKAVTYKSTTTTKSEYAVGDKGKITYIKNSYVSASGKETSDFNYDYAEVGGVNLRKSQLSDLTSARSSGGVLGATKDGKLYYVYYIETSSRGTAYNDDGETVSGIYRTYNHSLFDLNSISEPKFLSISSVSVIETNIDRDGVKANDFHVASKTSSKSTFEYGNIVDNEAKRSSLISAYPDETVNNFQVDAFANGSPHRSIGLSQDSIDTTKYTSLFEFASTGLAWAFAYNASKYQIDKQSETVSAVQVSSEPLPFNSSVLVRGEYPEDVATISNNSITLHRSLKMRLSFQSSKTDPYLSITSIELL